MASRVKRDHHTWTRDTIKNVSGDVTLDLAGDLTVDVTGGQMTIVDDTNGDPDLIIKCTSSNSAPDLGGAIHFEKNKDGTGADAEDGDLLGQILFQGYNDAGTPAKLTYAHIYSQSGDVTEDSESGILNFLVKTKDSGGSGTEIGFQLTGSDTNDEVDVTIANGAASVTTIAGDLDIDGDSITSAGALEIDPGGALSITGQNVSIDATKKLYFDGSGDTYITEVLADTLGIAAGGDYILTLAEYGNDGNEANFKTSCATFTRQEATFSTTGVIGSPGSDDTDIDFRHSNKYRLEMTADIQMMNLIFPSGSGNFTLVCTTNGDHDVTTWAVYESDESAATTNEVMWAGGSSPAFTNNGIDIVSFYWDANEQQCYGVASLAFATP